MKRYSLALLTCLLALEALAQLETPSGQFTPAKIKAYTGSDLDWVIYDNLAFNANGDLLSGTRNFGVKEPKAVFTLFTNPNLETPPAVGYKVNVKCLVEAKDYTGAMQSDTFSLSIHYDPASGATYKAKDSYVQQNAGWSKLIIKGATYSTLAGQPFEPAQDLFFLRHQLQIERYRIPNLAQAPALVRDSAQCHHLNVLFRWKPVDWAIWYDVEWTFTDDYRYPPPQRIPASQLRYNFRHNSTRVRVKATSYEIPAVFERGYIVYRVRAVSKWGADYQQIVTGDWSLPEEGPLPNPLTDRAVFTMQNGYESDRMNWQYVGTYSEEGKRKDVVQFADGTNRVRQSIANLSTEKKLLVGETVYDHIGRPAVQMLPAPVSSNLGGCPANENPALLFKPAFNQNPDKLPYSWQDFETDAPDGCNLTVRMVSKGAADYYGINNPDKTGHQAYVPDAEDFPFVHTQYTPDLTGRVRKQGGAGKDFQLGSGHERKFFYGVPSQAELDKVFGNDAGFSNHYRKDAVMDENGQMFLTFKNLQGQTVATALAGTAPANLTPLGHPAPTQIVVDLAAEDNRREAGSNSLVASRQLIISTPTEAVFLYRLTPNRFSPDCPEVPGLCYDCIYDLQIEVSDDCGNRLLNISETIGSLANLASCEEPVAFRQENRDSLQPGSYFITKRLRVNEAAQARYLANYMELPCVQNQRARFQAEAESEIDTALCNPPCTSCELTLDTNDLRTRMVDHDDDESTPPISVSFPPAVRDSIAGGCVPVCPDTVANECEVALQMMRIDLSPGGQYAEYHDSSRLDDPLGPIHPETFPLSIFNPDNALYMPSAYFKTPASDYLNNDGSVSRIEVRPGISYSGDAELVDGRYYIKPQQLDSLGDFIEHWQASWADALLPFHPEYGYYIWCIQNEASNDFNARMLNTDRYADALDSNLTDLHTHLSDEPLDPLDPFFELHPEAVSEMRNSLNRTYEVESIAFNIGEAAYLFCHCANRGFTSPEQFATCLYGHRIYESGNTETNDREWQMYRSLYLAKKRAVEEMLRPVVISLRGYFLNDGIGEVSGGNYRDKVKRFPNANEVPFTDEHGNAVFDNQADFQTYHAARQRRDCGLCPVAKDLESFLNALAFENRLTQTTALPGLPPLSMTPAMVAQLTPGVWEYQWLPVEVSETTLRVQLRVAGSGALACELVLAKNTGTGSWSDFRFFNCMAATGNFTFTLTGYDENLARVELNGSTTRFQLQTCPSVQNARVCVKKEEANDLGVFLNYLFRNNLHRSPSTIVHRAGSRDAHFPESLSRRFPDATTWTWRYRSGTPLVLRAWLSARGSVTTDNCNFFLQVVETGFTLDDAERILEIRRGVFSGGGTDSTRFLLTALNAAGVTFHIRGHSCFEIYSCISFANTPASPGLCCIPIFPRSVPYSLPCPDRLRQEADLRARFRFRNWLEYTRDSIGNAYAEHCLRAAEQFTATYADDTYHYTLFYYDRAGNLLKTVPPNGVRFLNASGIAQAGNYRRRGSGSPVYPNHTMPGTYAYNTLNEVVSKTTPDGGTTLNCYDELGRVILSQDAQQRLEKACTYQAYDPIGRLQESGRLLTGGAAIPAKMNYTSTFLSIWLALNARSEVHRTIYDQPFSAATAAWFDRGRQGNLRNRPSAMLYYQGNPKSSPYNYAMHYSYDVHGNVQEFVQEYPGLAGLSPAFATGNHQVKKINYKYDLLTGKITREIYQPGKEDQFVHWFEYDADNRLTKVQTGTSLFEDEMVRDVDAAYSYYEHGPLARTVLGKEQVQGLDYAYTIQGWLKGVNADALSPGRDIGKDGSAGSMVTPDAFGFTTGYFQDDYKAIGRSTIGANSFELPTAGTPLEQGSLFNGNIRHVALANAGMPEFPVQASAYRYDQLNRLVGSIFYRSEGSGWSEPSGGSGGLSPYSTTYQYDPNGNLLKLRRAGGGGIFDNLTYQYPANNNKLRKIEDTGQRLPDRSDLPNQPNTNNYVYDAGGRLLRDRSEGNLTLAWTNSDKLKSQTRDGRTLRFEHDALGRRLLKWADAANFMFYVRDAAGNVMAEYEMRKDTFFWLDAPIYGASRLGMFQPEKRLSGASLADARRFSAWRGQKRYELTSHTGDVLAVVSDRRAPSGGTEFPWKADLRSSQDYFPFGMPMPGRAMAVGEAYRFGFQGMEREDAIKGEGNAYSTEFRQYDARVGRWLSIDPVENYGVSPYSAFSNNPTLLTDQYGDVVLSLAETSSDSEMRDWDYRRVEVAASFMDHTNRPGFRGKVAYIRVNDATGRLIDQRTVTIDENGTANFGHLYLPPSSRIALYVRREGMPSGDPNALAGVSGEATPGDASDDLIDRPNPRQGLYLNAAQTFNPMTAENVTIMQTGQGDLRGAENGTLDENHQDRAVSGSMTLGGRLEVGAQGQGGPEAVAGEVGGHGDIEGSGSTTFGRVHSTGTSHTNIATRRTERTRTSAHGTEIHITTEGRSPGRRLIIGSSPYELPRPRRTRQSRESRECNCSND